MRLPATLLAVLYLLNSQTRPVSASPLPTKDELLNWNWMRHLFDRQTACAGTYCGESSQYCCTGGSVCYTDAATIARCAAPTAVPDVFVSVPGWEYYTTTYVQTDLVTVVITTSAYIGAPAGTTAYLPQSTAVCANPAGSCGAVCCDVSVETCYVLGKCIPYGAMTSTAVTTVSASAPLRGTSGAPSTVVISATTTGPFGTPVGTAGGAYVLPQVTSSSPGLSGGAIAGIVIGVLAGILILIAICFFCILKTGWDILLDLCGLGGRRRERTEVIEEERYSRRGSVSASRRNGGRSTRVTEKRKSGWAREGGMLAAVALALAGLWAVLGLRRKSKAKPPRSDGSYSTYSDSYSGTGTTNSNLSSDRRTRETRVTRESRRVTSRPR